MRLLILLLCFPFSLLAQVPDTMRADSARVQLSTASAEIQTPEMDSIESEMIASQKKDTTFFLKRFIKKTVTTYPNPNHALLAGLIIPGAGQIYNGSMWKVPLVYGAYGTVIYFISTNSREYNYWRDQYFRRVNDPGNPTDDLGDLFTNSDQIRTIRDEYRRRRDYSWVALVGVTIMSIADAFVDCHLKKFDISDDLSFQIKPVLTNTPGWGQNAGLGFSIPIR